MGNVAGVLIGGSTGEAPNLTLEERIRVIDEVAAHVDGGMALVVSIADNAMENSRRLAAAAADAGAVLLVASCPNYFSSEATALPDYFAAIGDLAELDLCLYDNPAASHTTLSVADIQELMSAAPSLTHVKVTDRALEKVDALRHSTNLVIHAGDDSVLWHQLTRGAEGAMVATPLVYPDRARAFWESFSNGDRASAMDVYGSLVRFIHIGLSAGDYVQVVKTALHHLGVISSPEVRLPLGNLAPARVAEVIGAL
jgi:4-hydroxy-tetrahydrodipicolinate synthase